MEHFVEPCSCCSKGELYALCERVLPSKNTPRGPLRGLEHRHGLAEIGERGVGVPDERPRINNAYARVHIGFDQSRLGLVNQYLGPAPPFRQSRRALGRGGGGARSPAARDARRPGHGLDVLGGGDALARAVQPVRARSR